MTLLVDDADDQWCYRIRRRRCFVCWPSSPHAIRTIDTRSFVGLFVSFGGLYDVGDSNQTSERGSSGSLNLKPLECLLTAVAQDSNDGCHNN